MDKSKLKPIIEAILFASSEPMGVSELKKILETSKIDETEPPDVSKAILPDENKSESADVRIQLKEQSERLSEEISLSEIRDILEALVDDCGHNPEKGFELVNVAKGFQFRTKPALAPYLKNLYKLPKPRLSAPSMETLAIVAYQQPVGRHKVEQIRGVDSGAVLKTLLDREFIRIVGRSEEPGRPILYGTAPYFLEMFGLHTLSDLPTLKDLEALEESAGGSPATSMETVEEFQDTFTDEGAQKLVQELESSMRDLRDVEKNIFPETREVPDVPLPDKPEI